MSKEMSQEMTANVQATLERAFRTLEEKVIPSHAALIVVDVQNDFAAQGSYLVKEFSTVGDMVPRLLKLIEKAREANVPIIYIQSHYNTEDNRYLSEVWLEQVSRKREKGGYVKYPVCAPNSWGADFYGGIRPLPGEIIVHKHRYSAFMDTDLDLILRSKGIKTLIMTGIATNVCVETTARDGFMKDYYIVFLGDCTATFSEEMHNNTLKNIDLFFGQVVNSVDVVSCWKKQLAKIHATR